MTVISPPHLLDSARWSGKRIGLLGGSYNPPHEGHVHISLLALNNLKLDYVWWLLTPQNPLKDKNDMMDYDQRFSLCREIVNHPQIIPTDLERQLGVNRSYKTVKGLRSHFPRTNFVLLTGMDNAHIFHKWYRWQDILKEVPTAHIARPPAETLVQNCPLHMDTRQNHLHIEKAKKVDLSPGNTYWIMQKKMINISSTKIRK